MTVTFISNVAATNPNLPHAERDDLLLGVAGGIDLFDISHPWCYRSAGDAINGQTLFNLARDQDNGTVLLPVGANAVRAGGGLSLTSSGFQYAGALFPADVVAPIYAEQKYILCAYVKIPTTADWANGASRFIGGNLNSTEIIASAQFVGGTVGQIAVRRITGAGGAAEQRTYVIPEEHRGKVAQISIYRTAEKWGFIINADGFSYDSNQAAGGLSSYDWSTSRVLMGIAGATSITTRIYRGFVEDLAVTGRDPVAVLNADWLRAMELGLFS